jgi:type VI secretion system protein ImpJ
MSGELARVRWQVGQTLRPEHFEAQEGALLEESALRFRLRGLPAYGIAAFRWNESLLREGVVSIMSATLVMPSGHLVEVPNNAVATSLNVNMSGQNEVNVYLHLMQAPVEDGDDELHGAGALPRVVRQLALSCDQSVPGALSTLKLAELKRAPEGGWQPSPSYLPPLLLVGASPFLQKELEELLPALEAFQYKVMMDSTSYLSGSSLAMVKQCMKSVYRIRRLVANVKSQVHLHPYHLYEALKDFYVEVCFYRDSAPQHADEVYNHTQLATCFRHVLGPLVEQMRTAQKHTPYAPFVLRDGLYRLDLPAAVQRAREIYFLIQKSQVQRAVGLHEFKLASPSRLIMTHRLSLPGIPLEKADRPMLAHFFGPEVEFYCVQRGEEWEHALRDGAVAFYGRPELADLEFYLYWSTAA